MYDYILDKYIFLSVALKGLLNIIKPSKPHLGHSFHDFIQVTIYNYKNYSLIFRFLKVNLQFGHLKYVSLSPIVFQHIITPSKSQLGHFVDSCNFISLLLY